MKGVRWGRSGSWVLAFGPGLSVAPAPGSTGGSRRRQIDRNRVRIRLRRSLFGLFAPSFPRVVPGHGRRTSPSQWRCFGSVLPNSSGPRTRLGKTRFVKQHERARSETQSGSPRQIPCPQGPAGSNRRLRHRVNSTSYSDSATCREEPMRLDCAPSVRVLGLAQVFVGVLSTQMSEFSQGMESPEHPGRSMRPFRRFRRTAHRATL